MTGEIVLIPAAVIDALVASGAPWGWVGLTADPAEGVAVVTGYSAEDGARNNTLASEFVRGHYMFRFDTGGWQGVWYRVRPEARGLWHTLARQRSAVDPSLLERLVQGWRQPPADRPMLVITIDVDEDTRTIEAWHVMSGVAQPVDSVEVEENADRTRTLRPGWPVDELEGAVFTVVGVGSIGGAVCEGLADYGAQRLALVDHDRLLPHNLVRHRAHRRWVGRYKVNAQRQTLLDQYPYLDVYPFPVDVADAADAMRPLFRDSDVVICCADGIDARVVCSHLARWAGTPVVLACVLDEGAFGEVLRLGAGARTGCLLCQRGHMRAAGQLDPEPGLDLPYGTGSRHRPMTAVGGDLALVGRLAAKVAVATVLEKLGHPDQRLPGEHAILSLRSPADAAKPFDLPRSGMMRWLDVAPPRAGCPVCEIA
ncbi:MAG: ThiF family adenylyltransferase [Chloroflexota bacterium]